MQLNIAQKIFGIAAVVLVIMLAVALYSIRITAGIGNDLAVVVNRQLPIADAVARINVRILVQGVVMQRLFVKAEEHANLHTGSSRFAALGREIDNEFNMARRFIEAEEGVPRTIRQALKVLEADLVAIEQHYRAFETHGRLLVKTEADNDRKRFDELLPALNAKQDAIDGEISNLRRHIEDLTNAAVLRADKEERKLVVVNSSLTAIATLLALIFAGTVTRTLVRSIRNLVAGTKAVEAGDLDTKVAITTRDEVGQLTKSFNGMVDGLKLKERIKETFGKYVDPRIVSGLLNNPEFSEPGGERREMTVMFIDLKGFTSISEKASANDLVYLINDFYSHMSNAIAQNRGVVDKFIGDGVMAYWGPPFTDKDEHANYACKAALDALNRLQIFRDEIKKRLSEQSEDLEIDLRIGISSGEMIVGTLGSDVSRSFTVLGDCVNLGARLEGACKQYGTRVLISERTNVLAGKTIASREIDLIRVKGREKPTRIFELLNDDHQPAVIGRFATALEAYRDRQWGVAESAFRRCLVDLPEDPPSKVYLQRVVRLADTPPPPDWDGVWVLESK